MKNHIVRATVYFDDVLLDRSLYSIELEVSGKVVNVGIGPYEFWGAHYSDNRDGIEEFDIDAIDIELIDPETNEESPVTNQETIDKLKNWVYEMQTDEVLDKLEAAMHDDYDDA